MNISINSEPNQQICNVTDKANSHKNGFFPRADADAKPWLRGYEVKKSIYESASENRAVRFAAQKPEAA